MIDQDQAEERIQSLREMRGPNLVDALMKELSLLHAQVSQLQTEMAAYRDYQATKDRWLAIDSQKARVQLPRVVAIDASQSLHPRQGFYGLEHSKRGVPFSWTGPSGHFSFDVFIDRSHGAELELRALGCIDFERQKNIRLLWNGEPVATTVIAKGGGLVLKAELPPRDDDRATNLVFSVPEVLQPADPADKRLLGIAFTSLCINALTEREPANDSRSKPDDIVVSLTRGAAAKRPDNEAETASSIVATGAAAS